MMSENVIISCNVSCFQLPDRSIYWRALLQEVLCDVTGVGRDDWRARNGWQVGKIALKCRTFTEYVRKALEKLHLDHHEVGITHNNLECHTLFSPLSNTSNTLSPGHTVWGNMTGTLSLGPLASSTSHSRSSLSIPLRRPTTVLLAFLMIISSLTFP